MTHDGRTLETAGWLTTGVANLLAWAQSMPVGAAASTVTLVGGAVVGVVILYRQKMLELDRREQQDQIQNERDRIAVEKERQQAMAESLTGKLEHALSKIEDLTDELRSSERLRQLTQKENETLQAIVRRLQRHEAAINTNADVTAGIARDAGSGEIKVAHVEDTSSDLPTLRG